MTEYQEKQWNIFICNVSFSLFYSNGMQLLFAFDIIFTPHSLE